MCIAAACHIRHRAALSLMLMMVAGTAYSFLMGCLVASLCAQHNWYQILQTLNPLPQDDVTIPLQCCRLLKHQHHMPALRVVLDVAAPIDRCVFV